MSGYRELKAQADELMKRVEEARLAELETVIHEVRARVAEYGLTSGQIFGPHRASKAMRRKRASMPRYRDPETGATWSGRGREPRWIKGGRRELFLIKASTG
ncbi:H-NS family nucleoid-associated regulatory protein [Burkholderia gladioli]|jgi:DNA-binding protein H-NS|uniref:H-NS histone family protein n=2 Tax=Burkholderia gladioli TaxID=28095 RepID=A0AAP8S6A8_BURGA|nr:H-NS histone family protein [Burkholderia gladioli]AEA63260.1 histone family protein nucleoid-structuring protein H-NS [Burkholderia gladioli BSR3]AJW95785.1 H-NS histone family protein [Burkholderia gladioli]ASD82751.1 H-NS histone [Burkholderia gladioli pv. gladioli]AWY50188.1 H-NS histone [Burkholderia gladioli pv. gladioli]KAF1059770.1 DNA-binding protein Bv3F [Burkholderia gladioli]